MTLRWLAVALCFWVAVGQAQEYQPYPEARITPEQWQSYYELVRSNHGETAREYPEQKLVVFNDASQRMQLAFTMPGHPAHPAWVTRQTIEIDGTVSIQQIGYFAGDEAPFAELFRAYGRLTEQTRLENAAKARATEYLTARAEGRLEDAYGLLSDDMRSYSSLPEWRQERSDFYRYAGRIKSLEILRVTVYDNPQNAPYPGIYIATDFEVEYENLPIHCGYLVWFQRDDEPLVLMREEMGSITAEQLERLTAEQLLNARRRFNCHVR